MAEVEGKAGASQQKVQFEHDELYQAYAAKGEEWHRRMTRRLMRKVDLHLLPLLVIMYLLNFLDRKYAPQPCPGRTGSTPVRLRLSGRTGLFTMSWSIWAKR
jgi:hypothetical protein